MKKSMLRTPDSSSTLLDEIELEQPRSEEPPSESLDAFLRPEYTLPPKNSRNAAADEEEDPLPHTPWLEVLVCNCNCSRYPSTGNVIVDGTDSTTQQPCQSSTDSTDMSEEEEGSGTSHDEVSGET